MYEAPDYTEEGVKEFRKSIDDQEWIKSREFIGAFEDNELLGLIALKDFNHITLFFVDGKYHKKGIGKKLFLRVCELNTSGFYTVNSSPLAKQVYEHLGFVSTSEEQSINGLKFFPMVNTHIKEYLESNIKKSNKVL